MYLIIIFFTRTYIPVVLLLAFSIRGRLRIQLPGQRSGTGEVITDESSGDGFDMKHEQLKMGFGLTLLADGRVLSVVRHLQETNKFYDGPRVGRQTRLRKPWSGCDWGDWEAGSRWPREGAVEDPTARQW
jgi:hypothetical protein